MKRRSVIGATFGSLATTTIALPGCGDRQQASTPEPVTLPPFSAASLHEKLDLLVSAYAAKSPKTLPSLQAGLSESQIRERTAWFPNALPQEVIALYQWRNGFAAPKDSDVTPFQFRDYTFLPIEEVQREYRSMNDTYGAHPPHTDLLANSFPFAALGGGWLVVSATKQALATQFERPVVSVFQGVSVFFYSMEKMAETCHAWWSHPKHNGVYLPPKDELEVWRKVNPGIFP